MSSRHQFHFYEFFAGGDFDGFADSVLAKYEPSMGELSRIACSRRWEVMRHPMTQLYKMIDPHWYRDFVDRHGQRRRYDSLRSYKGTRAILKKSGDSSRTWNELCKAFLKAFPGVHRGPGNETYARWSNRKRLLQAKRYRAITRKNKVASLNDKYGRPRVSRTDAPSR